ncbi:MAG: Hsp70 family protein [Hungatella sp.]|nr:Hsp70 family protein [Hungatella sp.]
MAIIGIDLGTTNSLVSVWENGHAVLIPNRFGSCLTPSVVAEAAGEICVGAPAKEKRLTEPENSAALFKRYMGLEAQAPLGDKWYSPQELSAMILRQLKRDAQEYLGEPVEEAIISVPAYFNDEQRFVTRQAGVLAGLKVERLINEPSAAALACRSLNGDEDETFLVIDFGGGTLDVSVVECFDQVIEILAVSGDNRLGGEEFDKRIARHFCREHQIEYGLLEPKQQQMLLKSAELCKRQMTEKSAALMEWTGPDGKKGLILTAEDMVRISAPLLKRMEEIVHKALRDVSMTAEDIDKVVLVGGTCRMPVIRQYIRHFMGAEPVMVKNPDEVVALGVGTYAGIKERREDIKDIVLTDICPFTLGIGVRDDSSGELIMSPVIERNCILPFSHEEEFWPVSKTQTHVAVRIYQGEAMYCKKNLFLGKIDIAVPEGSEEHRKVTVRFTYDINGILEVEAANEAGQKARKLIVNSQIRMSEKELERKIEQIKNLKYMSRDEEWNTLVLARGERLYEECLGEDRRVVAANTQWLRTVMKGKNPAAVRAARKQVERIFEYLEEKLGIDEETIGEET